MTGVQVCRFCPASCSSGVCASVTRCISSMASEGMCACSLDAFLVGILMCLRQPCW